MSAHPAPWPSSSACALVRVANRCPAATLAPRVHRLDRPRRRPAAPRGGRADRARAPRAPSSNVRASALRRRPASRPSRRGMSLCEMAAKKRQSKIRRAARLCMRRYYNIGRSVDANRFRAVRPRVSVLLTEASCESSRSSTRSLVRAWTQTRRATRVRADPRRAEAARPQRRHSHHRRAAATRASSRRPPWRDRADLVIVWGGDGT